MATIIEMKEDKLQHLSEYAEKVLRYGGKLMQCIEELEGKSKYSEYRGSESHKYDKERWGDDQYRPRYY